MYRTQHFVVRFRSVGRLSVIALSKQGGCTLERAIQCLDNGGTLDCSQKFVLDQYYATPYTASKEQQILRGGMEID